MKTEIINIRVNEKTKLKLLQKSKYCGNTLSGFILDATEKACNLDIIQVWIHAYIDCATNDRHTPVITHYKTLEGDDAWRVCVFEDTYYNRIDLLKALDERSDFDLPRMWDVLEKWDEFVKRLASLGLWEEDNVIR